MNHRIGPDRLGSVVAATNVNGTRAASVAYTAWGAERSPSGDVGALGFTGEYTDPATGFVYLRARWYDPATAEFITRDPAESLTGDPYAYAANSPLAFTDPLGLWPSWEDVGDTIGGAASWVGDRASDVWNTDLGSTDWGGMAAAGFNVGYGTYSFVGGVVILSGGTAATATIPIVGLVAGPVAIVFGGYKVLSGGARTYRGLGQIQDLIDCGQVEAGPDGQSLGDNVGRFWYNVTPSLSEGLWDWLGGLP